MKHIVNFSLIIVFIVTYGCGNENQCRKKMMPTANKIQKSIIETNSISQSLLTMMVISSDALFDRIGCFKTFNNQGKASYVRSYDRAFIVNGDLKYVIANIEGTR